MSKWVTGEWLRAGWSGSPEQAETRGEEGRDSSASLSAGNFARGEGLGERPCSQETLEKKQNSNFIFRCKKSY